MAVVCVIPGDDAAPEAMNAAVHVLNELTPEIDLVELPVDEGSGGSLSDESKNTIDRADATLFGATSRRNGAIAYLRWGKKTYANIRPITYMSGAKSPLSNPNDIDFVIVRENTEDLYVAIEGDLETIRPLQLQPYRGSGIPESGDGKFAVKVITEEATSRIAHYAFSFARERKQDGYPGRVTMSCKYNTLPTSDGFFRQIVQVVAKEYPDIEYRDFIIDDFARRIVVEPQELDVVLLPNMYGDILSDEASGLIGGLGIPPSGCYGDDYAYFEPIHGSAPDIQGLGVINPTATMLSAAMMLTYLRFTEQANHLRAAIRNVYQEQLHLTRDQGGTASTEEFTSEVLRKLAELS